MSSMDEIRGEYKELTDLPANADGYAKRQRGHAFERLLYKLLLLDELEPRTGYRPTGEQIDGSLYFDGRMYLLEAKWHADPLPASTLYQFKGKVDGKLVGSIGIFISMSGYAKDAVDALVLGKGLNIILFDQRDMEAAIIRGVGFKSILKLKLRKAAEEGAIYFPTESELVTADRTSTVAIDHLRYDRATDRVFEAQTLEPATADLLIVCEGDIDRVVIATLAERILASNGSGRSIKILTAMGKAIIPRVANALWNTVSSTSKVLIVVDGDDDPTGTDMMLANGLEFTDWIAAIPNPSIETWLGIDLEDVRRKGVRHRLDQAELAAKMLDIDELRARDVEFAHFYGAILGT
ncbi:MAG: hypothetical protein HWE30_10820 [Methylocystaceae bacterium]|nr:hypothetical protein [Methylocystaceae bacterium]